MSPRRRVSRIVATGLMLTVPLTGCGLIDAANDLARGSSDHTSSAQPAEKPATSVPERMRQSRTEAFLDPTKAGTRTSGGAMLAASPGKTIPDGVVRAAADAAASVRKLDSHVSADPLLVLVPSSNEEFKRWTGQDVGDQLANTVTGGGRKPYIVLAPVTVDAPDRDTTRETLVHEAFHAMTLDRLRTERPLWLIEGWAEYVGQRTEPVAPHKRNDIVPHLPTDADLRGPDADRAYYEAFTFARFLRDTFGHDKVMDFYTEAVSTTTSLDTLLKRFFGQGQDALEARYAAWYPTFR